MLLALVMVLSAFPISAFAAPASDIPDKMLDNPIVRALAYTGYNVQKQKDNGTIYQTGHYGGALKLHPRRQEPEGAVGELAAPVYNKFESKIAFFRPVFLQVHYHYSGYPFRAQGTFLLSYL